MQERSTTSSAAFSVPTYSDLRAPLLVCFSHLRWDFVWQRPQHLLSRAAKHYRVLMIEEPKFVPEAVTPRLDVSVRPGGITIAVPVLSEQMSDAEVVLTQRELVEELLARDADTQRASGIELPPGIARRWIARQICAVRAHQAAQAARNGLPDARIELFEIARSQCARSETVESAVGGRAAQHPR